jgi:hypothetical protein
MLWAQAHDAIGRPEQGPVFARCSDVELREMQARFARERQWAPPEVAEQLQSAHTLATQQRQEHAFAAAKAAMLEPGPEQQRLLDQAERAQRRAALWTERATQLEPLHQARQGWAESVAEIADLATHAGHELRNRRPAEPITEAGIAVQLDLFTGRPAHSMNTSVDSGVQLDLFTGEPEMSQTAEQAPAQTEVRHSAEVAAEVASPAGGVEEPVNERQLSLLELAPSLRDEVAAMAVREQSLTSAEGDRERDQAALSLAEARRHAHAAEQQRQLREQQVRRGEGQQVRDLLAAARAERERRHQLGQEPEQQIQHAARDRDAELSRMATADPERPDTGPDAVGAEALSRIDARLREIREHHTASGLEADAGDEPAYQRRSQSQELEPETGQELDQGYGIER